MPTATNAQHNPVDTLGSPANPINDLSDLAWRARRPLKPADNFVDLLSHHGIVVDKSMFADMDDDTLIRQLAHDNALPMAELLRWRAYRNGIPNITLEQFHGDKLALALVPNHFARTHNVVPLAIVDDVLMVAVSDPSDLESLHYLEFFSSHAVELLVAPREEIEFAIARFYGPQDDADVLSDIGTPDAEADSSNNTQNAKELEQIGSAKPTVRLVQNIIDDAILSRASDIHIRPLEKDVILYFRIDGQLIEMRKFEKSALSAVVSRIKILGGMNISERRLPQDGRAKVNCAGREIDLRLSVIPSVNGESVVIRILDTAMGLRKLEQLGLSLHDQRIFRDMIEQSHGIILVTGPTGSGKSTTLYAALQEIRQRGVNIITVEDPVEYRLEGVTQIQVQPAIDYSFARALRHILRHDPDVIMIGEIRDEETAKIAVESALTGHVVLSTLHTNSAATTVTRLLEIGVEPYLVNSALLGVMAQRLVRRNCPHCMAPEVVEPFIAEALGVASNEPFVKGRGCQHCRNTGYRGRAAVYELMKITPSLRNRIQAGVLADELETIAVKEGMLSLTREALALARNGVTSLAEVYRIRLQ